MEEIHQPIATESGGAPPHPFAVGDKVCIVGTWRPVVVPVVGTVARVCPGETYDVWAKFGQREYPFRADELALALDVEGAEAIAATATEPVPAPRPAQPSATRVGVGVLLGLALGIITGVAAVPPTVETVTITRTITHDVPPVCVTAINAGSIERELRKEWETQAEFARQHTVLMVDAESKGNADLTLTEQRLANEAALKRDAAEFARIGAHQSADENGDLCLTHTEPVAATTKVVAR
jgi:hypothetical protein